MDRFREFEGKNLDEAIRDACEYFGCPREKMEIEILKDAKSGIFGLVGARKAKVRARRAQLDEVMESILGKKSAEENNRAPDRIEEKKDEQKRPAPEAHAASLPARAREKMAARRKNAAPQAPAKKTEKPENRQQPGKNGRVENAGKGLPEPDTKQLMPEDGVDAAVPVSQGGTAARHLRENFPVAGSHRASGKKGHFANGGKAENRHEKRSFASYARVDEPLCEDVGEEGHEELDSAADGLPLTPVEELDAERLEETVKEVVSRLVAPIACRETSVSVELGNRRVRARVEWQGDAGLLIGREGMTLVALQYLASRMVSRAMNAALRVQLDIGDYRRRQDDKLKETAKLLAEKARQTGRSYSTRPLSSYHRRIIHMTLQDEPNVHTRSAGEGAMKRVVISPRKGSAESAACRS